MAIAAVAGASLIAASAAYLWQVAGAPDKPHLTTADSSAPPSAAPTLDQARRPSTKLQDAPLAALGPERLEPYRISSPFEIADGLTFGPDGAVRTRLAGLEGPEREAICNDRDGRPWACGLRARATLHNLIRLSTLTCTPVGPPSGGVVPARCSGEADLARELVRAGFARPTGADPVLDEALEDARRNERGLWNGGWTIRAALR